MRQAERLGIKVRWTTDPDEVDKFSKLHAKFMARKGFHAEPDSDFYAEVQRLGGEGSGIALALADLDGETIAGHLNSDLGDTSVYLLAYRDAADRRNNAAHLLNWAAIVRAHELGMKWYDLGGIDPQANPGGYRFKSGMRGLDVTAAGPMELAPGPIAHRLVQGLEAVQRARRKRH
jgi:lipid II:glycine glycyltransferase (peptidoglycan interpeptide bridge formation enzyme)